MRDISCKYAEIRACAPKDSHCGDANINAFNDTE